MRLKCTFIFLYFTCGSFLFSAQDQNSWWFKKFEEAQWQTVPKPTNRRKIERVNILLEVFRSVVDWAKKQGASQNWVIKRDNLYFFLMEYDRHCSSNLWYEFDPNTFEFSFADRHFNYKEYCKQKRADDLRILEKLLKDDEDGDDEDLDGFSDEFSTVLPFRSEVLDQISVAAGRTVALTGLGNEIPTVPSIESDFGVLSDSQEKGKLKRRELKKIAIDWDEI